MKTKFLSTVIILLLSIIVSAQVNFIPGYVINLNGDTIWGEIDNRNYIDNAKFCKFRLSEEGSITTYTPIKIKGYAFVQDKKYESNVIDNKPVFLELLIEGAINLYFYKNENYQKTFYVSKDTSDVFLLKYEKGIKREDGKEYSYVSKPYVGLLYYLMSDVPNMKYFIDDLYAPKRESLIPLVNKYNEIKSYSGDSDFKEKQFKRQKFINLYGSIYYPVKKAESVDENFRQGFGINFLFQQVNVHERLYLGVGISTDGRFGDVFGELRIPLSIYYLHPKEGFSPVIYYQFNLINFISQSAGAGLRYKFGKISASAEIDVKTYVFVYPYLVSAKFGLFYEF